jgi:hypothetical protein
VRELIGNPAFKDGMKYAPEQHYEDEELGNRVYGETATGEKWWEIQASAAIQLFSHLRSDVHLLNFRGNFPSVRQYHLSTYPQTRRTFPGLLAISKGGRYTLLLGTSARTPVASSQNVLPFSLAISQSRNLSALMRKACYRRLLPVPQMHAIPFGTSD